MRLSIRKLLGIIVVLALLLKLGSLVLSIKTRYSADYSESAFKALKIDDSEQQMLVVSQA